MKTSRIGYRKTLSFLGFSAIFLFIPSCSSFHRDIAKEARSAQNRSQAIAVGDGLPLSQVLSQSQVQMDPKSARAKFLASLSSLHSKTCHARYPKAPECAWLDQSWMDEFLDESESPQEWVPQQRSAKVVGLWKKAFEQGRAEISEKYKSQHHPGDIYRALKKMNPLHLGLEKAAIALAQSEASCFHSELYYYLGMKFEEAFPVQSAQDLAKGVYAKADQCGKLGSGAQRESYVRKSRFRLALIYLDQNECSQAVPLLDQIGKGGENDLTTRALYWKAYCAKDSNNKDSYLSIYDQLLKLNPLGFHTLSMLGGDSHLVDQLQKDIDPKVERRSKNRPEMNNWISTLEEVVHLGQTELARKFFSPTRVNPQALNALEIPVRLYIASLAYRAKDTFALFRILDSVFRTRSEYVVDATLKLFYPMKHMEQIQSQVQTVSPLLVAALIRQESAFNENAKSRVGAVGLMQIMPKTARLMDRKMTVQKLFQSQNNIRLGVRYFESLVERFSGDVELALAAYNAGPLAVDAWLKRYPTSNKLLFLDRIPFSETRNYVTLIGRNFFWYTKIYQGKFASHVEPEQAFRSLTP